MVNACKNILMVLLFSGCFKTINLPHKSKLVVSISFSKDTVKYGDKLIVYYYVKNKSNKTIILDNRAEVHLLHWSRSIIDCASPIDCKLPVKKFESGNLTDKFISLKKREDFVLTYEIIVDTSFFDIVCTENIAGSITYWNNVHKEKIEFISVSQPEKIVIH